MGNSWSWSEALTQAAAEGFFVARAEPDELAAELPPGLRASLRPDVLRPRRADEGRPGTFSAHHGHGRFPWHTDGAIADHPPRFILLSSPITSETPTELLRMRIGAPLLEAMRGLVLFTRSIRPRYFRAVESTSTSQRVRWDPDKLKVVSPSAPDVSQWVPDPDARIEWRENTVALIDNWQCLHRRPELTEGDVGRILLRRYIHERARSV